MIWADLLCFITWHLILFQSYIHVIMAYTLIIIIIILPDNAIHNTE